MRAATRSRCWQCLESRRREGEALAHELRARLELIAAERERVEIELGLRDSQTEMVEARTGVAPGDTILLGTARGLTPGTAVRVSAPSDTKR